MRFLFVWVLFVLFLAKALAHDATPTPAKPQGWSYSFNCCSDFDCRMVNTPGSKVFVIDTAYGYVISTTGETIAPTSPMVKESPDGEFHWCSYEGRDDTGTICLYVPPRGM